MKVYVHLWLHLVEIFLEREKFKKKKLYRKSKQIFGSITFPETKNVRFMT